MDDGSLFSREIEAHLELQRQNRRLERRMPLDPYREEVVSGVAEDEPLSAARDTPEPEPEPELEAAPANGFPTEDPDSWWDARDEPETAEFGWRG
jgi:hypothetical protein